MEMLGLGSDMQEEWFLCMAFGAECGDWASTLMPASPLNSGKSVRFKHPVVTSCRYRPRETIEERRQLFFTDREMQMMRRMSQFRMLNNELEELKEKKQDSEGFQPKFETIAQADNEVKVMYAVPKRVRSAKSI